MRGPDPGGESARSFEQMHGDAANPLFASLQANQKPAPALSFQHGGARDQSWMKRFFTHPCSYGVQNADMSFKRLNFHSPPTLTYCSS